MSDQIERFSERTLADGGKQRSDYVDLATTIAGERLPDDILAVRGERTCYGNKTASELLVTGTGYLSKVNVANAGATGNAVTIYDGTDDTGTVMFAQTPPVVGSYDFADAKFLVGLYLKIAGTTPPNVSIVA